METKQFGAPLATGRTAEIYRWADGQIVKLFRDRFPPESVQYEARIARAIYEAGYPVPAVGPVVELNGRFGLIYQRVTGPTMLDVLRRRPWTFIRNGRLLAEMHVHMHQNQSTPDLPALAERLAHKIRHAQGLSAALQDAALASLAQMPAGDSLCHGDFHPGNLLLAEQGPVVIDWVDTTAGNALADVARTYLILASPPRTKGIASWPERVINRWFADVYRRHYFALHSAGEEQFHRWRPIVAAGRMSEGIKENEAWLRDQVAAGYSSASTL